MHLEKQVPGSGRHERTQRQLQEVRCQARRLREEAQHRAANDIVAKARMVVMEDLDIIDMMNQGGKLAGAVARFAMRSLQEKIAYRSAAAGVRLVKAPVDFPSTRMCSGCGETPGHAARTAGVRLPLLSPGSGPRPECRHQPDAIRGKNVPVKRTVRRLQLTGDVKRRGGCPHVGSR